MAKSPPKRLDNKPNQRTRIYCLVKVEHPKKLQQQISRKKELIKFNTIMDQLEELDGNGHGNKININHFAPLF